MNLHAHPLFHHLSAARRILVAGAGGGFDVYSGLPLYLSLRTQGKDVHLANFSFTDLRWTDARQVCPGCYEVTAQSMDGAGGDYFPEKYLCEWLLTQGIDAPVYAFEKMGIPPLKQAYEHLIRELGIDTVILVDGGTDSLMVGDEKSMGTPLEDMVSMAAVYQTGIAQQYLVCLGFGVDCFHGVSHYRFLENVSELIRTGGFLGAFSLLQTVEEGRQYAEAVAFVNKQMEWMQSIVCNSIVSAMEGQFGDHHVTDRTAGSELWINPLMSLYWCFRLQEVIALSKYYAAICDTKDLHEFRNSLLEYRMLLPEKRERRDLPV